MKLCVKLKYMKFSFLNFAVKEVTLQTTLFAAGNKCRYSTK